eukprot:2895981-Pyramimonas_sp.AAC.1
MQALNSKRRGARRSRSPTPPSAQPTPQPRDGLDKEDEGRKQTDDSTNQGGDVVAMSSTRHRDDPSVTSR